MTHANPEFSIIIVTHNSNYYLVECMKALTTQRNKNFEIIIVDNNSNEDLITVSYTHLTLPTILLV